MIPICLLHTILWIFAMFLIYELSFLQEGIFDFQYFRYIYILITPYIRMLDSDWLIAVIFFTNSGLALWICRIFTSCRCICIRFNFFFVVFAKSYLQFLPFTETLVIKFVKRYQLCVLCNNRICRFYPSPRRL